MRWTRCDLLLPALALLALAGCDDAPGRTALAADPASSGIGATEVLHPGDLALDYVTDQRYPSLLIEVDGIGEARPTWPALNALAEVLSRRLGKPGGVDVLVDDQIAAGPAGESYTEEDVAVLEALYRRHRTGDARNRDRAVIWAIYLDRPMRASPKAADLAADPKAGGHAGALALALGGSELALFVPAFEDALRGATPGARDHAEALALLHEIGHLCGLVNNGVPAASEHEDALHPFHDEDPDCVMHFRIEQGWLEQGVALDFGYSCRVDLYGVGGPDPGEPDEALATLAPPP